ncbi:MAG: tetratricopeptide repeat protein [Magnetococcales bacterium]|nr:tetratricopeptide repeat protein [Magnetococcales bacterium]
MNATRHHDGGLTRTGRSRTGNAMPGWLPRRLGLLVALLFLLMAGDAQALFSALDHAREEDGRMEVLTFPLAAATDIPTFELLEPQVLLVTIPRLFALPVPHTQESSKNSEERAKAIVSKFFQRFQVEAIPDGGHGLHLTIFLKEPNLDFRGSVIPATDKRGNGNGSGVLFRLETERPEKPVPTGPGRLLDSRILPGRDGTLAIFSHTGQGEIVPTIDYGSSRIRIHWPGAQLDRRWRETVPAGLVEQVVVYPFPQHLELELVMNKKASTAFFHAGPQAGLFIVELREKLIPLGETQTLGRSDEARAIIKNRQEALDQGLVPPLNRLTPVFVEDGKKVNLANDEVDQSFFYLGAKDAEKKRDYAKARGFLKSLLDVFPDSPNRELVSYDRTLLARRMDWKPGWLLKEYDNFLARYPNNFNFPRLRLWQLQALNDGEQFEQALGLLWDPNLPKDTPEVWMERARTSMGLADWENTASYLERIFNDPTAGDQLRGWARLMQARMAMARNDLPGAMAALDQLPEEELARVANNPAHLKEVADIYYRNGNDARALAVYIRFLESYPRDPTLSPWALLNAAQCRRHLKQFDSARNLLKQLALEFPGSPAHAMGRVYSVQIQDEDPNYPEKAKRSLEDRLKELATLIGSAPLEEIREEAFLTEATLFGTAQRHMEALGSLNRLLHRTSRGPTIERAQELKQRYMEDGMQLALENGRPEAAIQLAQAHESDWRRLEGFDTARIQVAEALLRMGLPAAAQPYLENNGDAATGQLAALATSQLNHSPLVLAPDAEVLSPRAARVRLAQAAAMNRSKEWEGVLILLENLQPDLLSAQDRDQRLRLLARAEVARGRFPQAVGNLEELLFDKPMKDGKDYYWYATVLQSWKGDAKALPAYQRVAAEAEDKETQALAHTRIGAILQAGGDIEGSRKAYQEATRLNPGSPWAKISQEKDRQLRMVQDMAE